MRRNLSVFPVLSLLMLTSCLTLSAENLLSGENFEVLYEKKFDKKIEKVAFDSSMENGEKHYYPKVVVFREEDTLVIEREYKHERFSNKKLFERVNKSVGIFSPRGEKIVSIKGPTITTFQDGEISISEKGKYLAILQRTIWRDFYSQITHLYFNQKEIHKKEKDNINKLYQLVKEKYEEEHGKLEESRLSVYNDKGEILWHKTLGIDIPYGAGYGIKVSPKDGSILFGLSVSPGSFVYGPEGNRNKKAYPAEIRQYLLQNEDYARNWKYIAISFKEEPTHFYKELPGESSNPGVALLDSNWNLLWKKSLENYLISGVEISPYGSYVATGTYTMKGTGEKGEKKGRRKNGSGIAEKTGYLFDRGGKLIMNTPLSGLTNEGLSLFSENENYFAAPDRKRLSLIELKKRKVIYEKTFNGVIWAVLVSNNGKCALLIRKDRKVYVFNREGHLVWDSGVRLKGIPLHSISLMDWNNGRLIIGVINKEVGEIQIGTVQCEGGK